MDDINVKLVEYYHYDQLKRLHSLEILELGIEENEIIQRIHRDFLDEKATEIVDRFYLKLWKHEEFKAFLKDPQQLARLKITQNKYLHELGIACETEHYFEGRLRVGLVHARIGLPLTLYISAYHLLFTIMLDSIPKAIREQRELYQRMLKVLSALITLDTTLAVEAYHFTEIGHLKNTVDNLLDEHTQLKHQAHYDALTGLFNHERILLHLNMALSDLPNDHALCVVMADLDHFKRVNDNYGHLMGDAVLRGISSRLRATMRGFDYIGRYGGEEFLIILQNTDLEEGEEIAERLRSQVEQSPFHHNNTSIPITVSLGLTHYHPGDTVENMIQRADEALYQAKAAGRNRVTIIP
ncbi:MAG: diguanylate cyclase [Gammaproteobacteria bacterium]|nr:diguanylate cyclase [Gammaproteobacteria bacterium]